MSRIAGLFGNHGLPPMAALLSMIAAVRRVQWETAFSSGGSMAAAWTGLTDPNFHQREGRFVVMDGNIYNRDAFGRRRPDAYHVLDLYEQHGFEGAIRRLNGDFAVALGDASTNSLWLARDRFGLKPMYYAKATDAVAFASRPQGVLAAPGVSHNVNQRFVGLFAGGHYRYFDNSPNDSPYAAVSQLPAAHYARIDASSILVKRYWSLEPGDDSVASEEELAEEYRARLLGAVKSRLAVASKPAFTLSGGMDSSSVLASAVYLTSAAQHAYSVVYDDKAFDESADITPMLRTCVAQWHTVPVGTPDVPALVSEMVSLHDEPVATATWLSHHLLCRRASNDGVRSLFGGLGGDELNAGEYEYFFYFFADLAAAGKQQDLALETEKWVEYHDHPVFRKSAAVMREGLSRLVDLDQPGRNRPDRRRLDRYQDALNPDFFDLARFEPEVESPFTSYLKNRTLQDLFRETIPCCLRAEDRQCTAEGLEHFLPFLDYPLVEFMFRVPGTMKFRRGVTKHTLRLAMRGLLPEETRTRIKKTGWNAPAHIWFAGPGAAMLRDLVRSQGFRERGIYRVETVCRIIDEHDRIVSSGEVADNHMMFLWQLLNLELWLQQTEKRLSAVRA
jgi:asparagine synthase (glutamine-hydrolysing)